MTADALPKTVDTNVPKASRKYERIGWAVMGRAAVRFEMPVAITGGAVYLLERIGERSPLKEVLDHGEAELFDGTGATRGKIYSSATGKLLLVSIDVAPALACVVRTQLTKHIERMEATPIRAFPGEAALWGVTA
jgi:hypothetical protein